MTKQTFRTETKKELKKLGAVVEMRRGIKKVIKNKGLTTMAISKGADVSYSTVYRIRNGEYDLDNLTLKNCERLYQYALETGAAKVE